jgi:hypothetical protein
MTNHCELDICYCPTSSPYAHVMIVVAYELAFSFSYYVLVIGTYSCISQTHFLFALQPFPYLYYRPVSVLVERSGIRQIRGYQGASLLLQTLGSVPSQRSSSTLYKLKDDLDTIDNKGNIANNLHVQ